MVYLRTSLVLSLLSIGLLLIGFFAENIKYGFIVAGIITGWIGIGMLITGAIKRYQEAS